ncbi:MAG: hypothetical protein ACI85O_003534, partial [Saprospiraceae bacterium]
FRYFPPKNSSVATAMQRFFEENYRKNLSLKFIHINNVTHLLGFSFFLYHYS